MRISKSGETAKHGDISGHDMELINAYTKERLEKDEVFTFSVVLCDNEVDRDLEAFEENTLSELKELFVGKTGISDHEWKSENQIARIYKTEIIRNRGKKTSDGREYVCLKAWAYMLRTQDNESLIAEISGGIKKEVSIGCSVADCVCSVCGDELAQCPHTKGETYFGKRCFGFLKGAVDAYEWSFVAVPAQRAAGVTKALDISKGLKGFVESAEGRAFGYEFDALCKDAELGRRYMKELRKEVSRLCLMCDKALHESLEPALSGMEATALMGMRDAFEKQLSEKMPLVTQLPGRGEATRFDDGQYIV